MRDIDWSLLIGYSQEEAEEYLKEEEVQYQVRLTRHPKFEETGSVDPEMRIIGVRYKGEQVELICAPMEWTVS